jgi:uncharacterized membrane protein YphA (DoxX/SURF4 family)
VNETCPTPTNESGAQPCACCKVFLEVVILLTRIAFGLFLLLAGYGKIHGGVGNFYWGTGDFAKFGGFLKLKPHWLPEFFASPYGHAVPFLEFGVGAALILGLLGRLSAFGAALMIGSFTIALYGAGALNMGPLPSVHPNFVYITLALLLAATGPGRISLDKLIGWRCCCKCCGKKKDQVQAVK